MSAAPPPATALALNGPDPAERIRRLLTARPAARRGVALLAGCATAAVLAVPAALVLAPAVAVADTAHCGQRCPR